MELSFRMTAVCLTSLWYLLTKSSEFLLFTKYNGFPFSWQMCLHYQYSIAFVCYWCVGAMPGALAGVSSKLAAIEEVEIDSTGRFKYILCKVYEQGGNPATGAVKHVVRGTSRAEFHCKLTISIYISYWFRIQHEQYTACCRFYEGRSISSRTIHVSSKKTTVASRKTLPLFNIILSWHVYPTFPAFHKSPWSPWHRNFSQWCWRSSERVLLNVWIVIKFKSFQRFFQWSKEMKFAWRKTLTVARMWQQFSTNSRNFFHGHKSLMWQVVIVLQYDTLPQQIWSFSVMQTLQNVNCSPPNQCSNSVLLPVHTNGCMSVSQNAV